MLSNSLFNSDSQNQKAGDNSTQLQISNLIIGIDEKRAREIFNEMILLSREGFSQEAIKEANIRIEKLENRLLNKISQDITKLSAFADPDFQMSLVDAQKSATRSERQSDYDLLSELLISRIDKGYNRNIKTGINRAIQVVNEITDEALLGITVFHSASSFLPAVGNISQGLDLLDKLYGMLIYADLPLGDAWLDQLDVLNAIRINNLGDFKDLVDFYSERLPGYTSVGIGKNSEQHHGATLLLQENNIPFNILVDHELIEGFVRLDIINRERINELEFISTDNRFHKIPLTETQKNVLFEIYDTYNQDPNLKQQILNKFKELYFLRPNLAKLHNWWSQFPYHFQITSVGKALAHANSQRCDNTLPPLKL